jgi:hypothetical protein
MPASKPMSARAKATVKKRNDKANASAIKSLKADNARRTKAMNAAAKAGIKLSGSRYEDGGAPNFSKREAMAVAAYSKTKGAQKDRAKAESARRTRTADMFAAKQRSKPAQRSKYTG